jgi:hypothetical protein
MGKPEGNVPLREPKRTLEVIIEMDLRKLGLDGMDWIDVAQDRDCWRTFVNTAVNLRAPKH